MKIIETTSLNESGLEPYKTLRRPVEHQRQGIFVAEGEKVVRRLLESRLEVLSVLLTQEWMEKLRSLLTDLPANIYVAPKDTVETIVGFPLHQGLMAVGKIPRGEVLSTLLEQSSRPYFFAAVEGLTNAENLGALVRNCAAFGTQALLVGETSSSPFLRRAVRNSLGTVFTLPIVHLEQLTKTIQDLRRLHNVRVIAAHPRASQTLSEWDEDIGSGICLVFGSEGAGISESVLSACDHALAVPMHHEVDSLNVASASAVFLHELRKKLG